MPELPEVETVARTLRPAILGATVRSVTVGEKTIVRHGPKRLGTRLKGRRLTAVLRHGKRLTFEFDPDVALHVHLGMTGSLILAEPGDVTEKHTHMVFCFEGAVPELRFVDPRRFGGVWLGDPSSGRFSADLGPDALEVPLREFRSIFARSRQAKALLLDQATLAGMGNIYCDEALFRAGIHPLVRGCDIPAEQVARLHQAMKTILKNAIAARGSTIRDYRSSDGGAGRFQLRHRVYGREGQPCTACGRTILRIQVASRSTHLCPACQPITKP